MTTPTATGPERPPGGSWNESLRAFAPFLGLGVQLAAAVLVFFFAGWWVDEQWGSAPWGRLVGVFVGSAGGLIKFIRTVSRPSFGDERKPPHAH